MKEPLRILLRNSVKFCVQAARYNKMRKIQDAEKSFAVRESRVMSSKVAHFLEVNDEEDKTQFNQRYTWTDKGETKVVDILAADSDEIKRQKMTDVPPIGKNASITAGGDRPKVEESYFIYDNDESITQKGEPKRFQEYFYSRSGTVSIGSILDLMPRKDIEPWKWRWTQAKASADPNGGSMQDMRARILAT